MISDDYRSPVALVTGGARRVGRAMCLALTDMGFHVAVHYGASVDEANELAGLIRDKGREAGVFGGDLTVSGAAGALYANVVDQLGAPSVLVNNASIFRSESLSQMTAEAMQANWQLHVASPLVLTQKLAENDGPALVVNMLDQRVLNPSPGFVSYNTSKAALAAATKSLAIELAPSGIRVNGIAPGPVVPPPGSDGATFDDYCATMPLGRGSSPTEIVRVLRFLVEARAVTGQIIASDGGQHLGHLSSAEATRNHALKVNS